MKRKSLFDIAMEQKHEKPNATDLRIIRKPEDIYSLEEVQEIKDALQEHFLFIGLDRGNHIRKISLLGIGTSAGIYIDSKQLIRTALLSASEKVIFMQYVSMNSINSIDRNYSNDNLKFMNNAFLIEENNS